MTITKYVVRQIHNHGSLVINMFPTFLKNNKANVLNISVT